MPFVIFGVMWSGYALMYWGYCHITGPRGGKDMSFGMLIQPKQAPDAVAWMKQAHPAGSKVGLTSNNAPSYGLTSPTTPANQAPPNAGRQTQPTSPSQGPPVNLGPGSGQATLPSVGGGPPAPTFG